MPPEKDRQFDNKIFKEVSQKPKIEDKNQEENMDFPKKGNLSPLLLSTLLKRRHRIKF